MQCNAEHFTLNGRRCVSRCLILNYAAAERSPSCDADCCKADLGMSAEEGLRSWNRKRSEF